MRKSLQHWTDNGTNITDYLIRQRALEIAKSFHISTDRFKGSSGWIENFKHRHDIRRGEWLKADRHPQHNTSFNAETIPESSAVVSYDQRVEAPPPTDSSSSSQASVVHSHSQDQISTQQWATSQDHHHQASIPLDPALQDASIVSTHPHLHDTHTAIQHSPQQVSYDYNHLYGPGAHVSHHYTGPVNVERPTLAETEIAINTVITYLNTDGKEILKPDEKMLLTQIKCALFQYANGIPYER